MVLKRGKVLRQNIVRNSVPDQKYTLAFWAKLVGMRSLSTKIVIRMRFTNNDVVYGPCNQRVCNLYERPLDATILASAANSDGWQKVVTDGFTMFDNYTQWDGNADFILFQMITSGMPSDGELRVANFEMIDDASAAPSVSLAPSTTPTSLAAPDVGYVVRYAGEVRTVIRTPFQVEATGEVLPMDGSEEYHLCDLDEVVGTLGEYPMNKLSFVIGGKCTPIKKGNPMVSSYSCFL